MNYLITGGTGSFATAFVDYLLQDAGAKRIAIYSRGEHAQEEMARRLKQHPALRFFIGDVRDQDRLEFAMRGVDIVVHAAALKIVPTAEYNPTECIATNIGGAENVVKAAIRSDVKRVLALSTDKAVNPINLYGASKLAAEKIFVAANALSAGRCMFSVMRYGNVVGSRGSVVPFFRSLVEQGKPLPITDERMTRFWITLGQAVLFADECLRAMAGREVFVPRIPSMRVVTLASMLSDNLQLNTGIRPGEKLHECLITEDEARNTIYRPFKFVILPSWAGMTGNLKEGWRYSSDTNEDWLTAEQMKAML